jgi:Domain of unknown function (DUF4281)
MCVCNRTVLALQVAVADGWAHFIAQDLFVGRWVYLDSRRNNVWAAHSLALCYLFGPIGVVSTFVSASAATVYKRYGSPPGSDACSATPASEASMRCVFISVDSSGL